MTENIAKVGVDRISPDFVTTGVNPAPSTSRQSEVSGQGKPIEEDLSESSAQEIADAIDQFKQRLVKQNLTANYVVDPESQSVTIFLVNPKTGDVERTIPPIPLNSVKARLSRRIGALIDGFL